MNVDPCSDLTALCNALNHAVFSREEHERAGIEQKVNALATYIQEHRTTLCKNLADDEIQRTVYERITTEIESLDSPSKQILLKEIQFLFFRVKLLKLEELAKNPRELVSFLNEREAGVITEKDLTSSPLKVLDAFDKIREFSTVPQEFQSEFDKTLSKMVLSSLGLENKTVEEVNALFKTKQIDERALASFVNAKEIALKSLDLPVESLNKLAPYLNYVDCRDIEFKEGGEAERFIKECSKAYQIFINSDKIKIIQNLPKALRELNCVGCCSLESVYCPDSTSLETLSLQGLTALKRIQCYDCKTLKTLNLEGLISLEEMCCYGCTSLRTLPLEGLTCLKKLYCSSCTSLTNLSLKGLIALNQVVCSYCTSLTALSLEGLTALEKLDCKDCTSLTILPIQDVRALKELSCNRCTSLRTLPLEGLINLEKLDCCYCTSLSKLSLLGLTVLKELKCRECTSLSEISLSGLTTLEKLDCCYCTSLTTLSLQGLTGLEEFYCISCTSLMTLSLSGLTALEKLDCRYCTSLTTLSVSGLTALKELCCNRCASLTTLSVEGFTALEKLECRNCNSLRALSFLGLEALLEILCADCQNLTSLGDSLPNTLRLLSCEGCPSLAQLPQVPPTATVYSGNSRCGHLNRFQVNPSEVQEKPLELLLRLGDILLKNQPFPNIVYIDPLTKEQAAGIDAGGLRRQFIYDLSQRLFKSPSDFPFIENVGSITGNFPIVDLTKKDQILALRTLARLIAFAATSNALITGPILSQNFYNAALTLAKDPLIENFQVPLTDKQKKELYFLAEYGYKPKIEENITKEEEQFLVIGDSIAIVAHELKAVLKQRLESFTLYEFIAKVQGVTVNAERLLQTTPQGNPRIIFNTERAPQIKDFVETFIQKFDNTQTLKEFVKFVLGSESIGIDEQIKVQIALNVSIDHLPITHTCFQSIEFPLYPTYKVFEEKLLLALSGKDSFGMG